MYSTTATIDDVFVTNDLDVSGNADITGNLQVTQYIEASLFRTDNGTDSPNTTIKTLNVGNFVQVLVFDALTANVRSVLYFSKTGSASTSASKIIVSESVGAYADVSGNDIVIKSDTGATSLSWVVIQYS